LNLIKQIKLKAGSISPAFYFGKIKDYQLKYRIEQQIEETRKESLSKTEGRSNWLCLPYFSKS